MYAAKASSSGHAVFEAEPGPPQPAPAAARRRAARRDRALGARCSPTSRRATCGPAGSSASRRSRAGEHPELGTLEPAEFVPLAEQTGLIIALTSSVLDAALERVAVVARARPRHLGRRQPLRALVPRCRARGGDPRAARRSRPPAGSARARDHRVDADARSRPRALHARAARRDRRRPSRSTTSARATRRSRTSRACPSTRSRSTSRSCSTWTRTTPTRRSCAR